MIESWRVMPKDVITATLHVMLYTKQIGSDKVLDTYEHTISSLCRDYYAAKDEVCVSISSDSSS